MAPNRSVADSRSVIDCRNLLTDQLMIAKSWQEKAASTQDVFARFFFLYTAFNALYFAWAKAGRQGNDEKQQIEYLLKKLPGITATEILDGVSTEIQFFLARNTPIRDMRNQGCNDPLQGEVSDDRRTAVWDDLRGGQEGEVSAKRLVALGKVVYFVLCNLVHGSKAERRGDDKDVITNAIGPLCEILCAAVAYTETELGRR
ncbi:MAG: hypothetical protein WC474_12230 [Hydrogenophilaceae bacterium]